MRRKELVFVNENLKNQNEVIEKLTDEVYKHGLIKDKEQFIAAVLKREEEFSTAVGYNFAIPHGKTDTVTEPFIAYLKTIDKFKWNEEDTSEVDTVFMIGVPESGKDVTHLRFLSQISRKLMNEEFRKELEDCNDCEETFVLLDQINNGIKKVND